MTQEDKMPWENLFEWSSTPYYGRVRSQREAEELINEFAYCTGVSFKDIGSHKEFGMFDLKSDTHTSCKKASK